MENNLGSMKAEFCYTQGRAIARVLIALVLAVVFVAAGVLLLAWWAEDLDDYMLYTGLFLLALGLGFLVWGLRARSSRTQIFENGITHARGKIERTVSFESIKGMTTATEEGWMSFLVGGLIGALLFGSGTSILRMHSINGPAVDIKGRHVYKFKKAKPAIEGAFGQYVLRNLTAENINTVTIMLTEKLELANGALSTSTGMIHSTPVVLPLADIVKVDNEKARIFRFIGKDETGAEAEKFKIAASELINRQIFERVLKLAGHPVA